MYQFYLGVRSGYDGRDNLQIRAVPFSVSVGAPAVLINTLRHIYTLLYSTVVRVYFALKYSVIMFAKSHVAVLHRNVKCAWIGRHNMHRQLPPTALPPQPDGTLQTGRTFLEHFETALFHQASVELVLRKLHPHAADVIIFTAFMTWYTNHCALGYCFFSGLVTSIKTLPSFLVRLAGRYWSSSGWLRTSPSLLSRESLARPQLSADAQTTHLAARPIVQRFEACSSGGTRKVEHAFMSTFSGYSPFPAGC